MENEENVNGFTLSILAIYNLLIGALSIYLIFLFIEIDNTPTSKLNLETKLCGLTMAGAVIGGIIRCMQGIHDFGLINKNFQKIHIGSYLIGPLAASMLGFSIYVFIHSGIFFLTGGKENISSQTTELAHVALGIVTGFSWESFLTKITGSTKSIIGEKEN